MNTTANYIKHRLSMREPLQESLDVVVKLTDELELKKEVDLGIELEKVKKLFPSFSDFERDFVSVAFSIATGVGKTRLMGAIITFLYLEKGIRNFFILAPNLTIYDKLIEDFGNPGYHKYVFSGISEFVHNRPVIITGDNYAQQSLLFAESEIRINIFNIAKFNSDSRGTRQGGVSLAPRIKRISEYLGQSYWDYLSGLNDLVILMDEAHRYHADASKNAINELKPVLGIELTATPFDEKRKAFKNIVYEYSLAQALADGKYVKNPAIATRKNFKKGSLTDREIEIIKLEDAISIHQDTKNELEIYSRNNQVKLVKPFVLVVCKDITHAKEIYDLLTGNSFYEGLYKGKVLQIDSSTKKEDEIERHFITLESQENDIEIVIHVNMLKEGWDVNNLYTIVPLRAANAAVLVEQTIGRGLRLPYDGKRTGEDKIDKLTVVAHENFEAVIEAAQDPESILNKISFVEIPDHEFSDKTIVITSKPIIERRLEVEQSRISILTDPDKRQKEQNYLESSKAIIQKITDPKMLPEVQKKEDLLKEDVKSNILQRIEQEMSYGQQNLFASQIVSEANLAYNRVVQEYIEHIIEIPRIDLVQSETIAEFQNFDLDTSAFDFKVLENEILRLGLKDHQVEILKTKSSIYVEDPVKYIIAGLIDYPEVDYDDCADLLYQLGDQAVGAIKENLEDKDDLSKVIFQYKTAIVEKIYRQMQEHLVLHVKDSGDLKVLPFTRIEPWNFSVHFQYGHKDFREGIDHSSLIPKYIFNGFQKACHEEYKFDSKAELDFAFVLENDKEVIKWLRPAPNQFRIYWDNNSKKYEPDFIIETIDKIYMVEIKRIDQTQNTDVLAKKASAERYCKLASEYTAKSKGKPWQYIMIPHNEVTRSVTLEYLVKVSR